MKLSKEDQSILAIVAGFAIISLISRNYFFLIICAVAIISFPFPKMKKAVHVIWVKFGEIIGWFMHRIILGILFYLILTPIALLKKILGNDSLQINRKGRDSTFQTRKHLFTPKDMEKVW